MTVIRIYEGHLGVIGIAKDYKSAIEYLVNNRWISKVWVGDIYYQRLDKDLEEDWFDKMCSWDIEKFNDYWNGFFELIETEVYGG